MASCTTAESQDELIGGMAMLVLFSEGDPREAEQMKAVKEILTKHGVKLDEPKTGANLGEGIKQLSAGVKSKADCTGELIAWVESSDEMKKKGELLSETVKGVLSDIKIEGNTATAKLTKKKDGNEATEEFKFKQVDGKWYADMTHITRPGGM